MIYSKDILIHPGELDPDKKHLSGKLIEALANTALDSGYVEEEPIYPIGINEDHET